MPRDFMTTALNASHWWRRGASGRGVRIAIFDTGLNAQHSFVSNVVEIVNFTGEESSEDIVGHSTFMTGTVASRDTEGCPGLAPNAEVTIVRVFDSTQTSTTAWFLDGFNFALHRRFDIINLAVGGPDFRDDAFASKVRRAAHPREPSLDPLRGGIDRSRTSL